MTDFFKKSNYKKSYIVALFTIFIFVGVAIFNTVYMISSHSEYAQLINKSGKQRMLSQRISLLSIQSRQLNDFEIRQNLEEMRQIHDSLINRELSDELYKLYFSTPYKLNKLFIKFSKHVENYIKHRNPKDLKQILHIQNNLLKYFDKAVFILEKESKDFSDFMVQVEIFIFICIALLLYLESKFIFSPMQRKIEKEKKQDKRSQKKLEQIVHNKTKSLEESLHIINHYVFTSKTDARGIITYVSDAFCELTGYSRDELIGNSHKIIKHPDNSSEDFKELWETLTSGKVYQGEVKNQKKNGEEFWLSSLIRPEFDENNNIIGYIAYRKDITHEKILEKMNTTLEKMVDEKTKELKENNILLQKLSETDALTGIANRKKLKTTLDLELKKASRYDEMFSIIILDIDHFKKVNDTYGHLTGDKVIINLSKLISKNIRDIDLFARWGGEEFVILVHNQDINQAYSIAEKLRKIIYEENIENLNITCSFGVTQYQAHDNSESIFKKADDALYKAKKSGRNCVFIK